MVPTSKDKIKALLIKNIAAQGKAATTATTQDWYTAVLGVLRPRLLKTWEETQKRRAASGQKQVAYLSMEYLPGPHTPTAAFAAGAERDMRQALTEFGQDPNEVFSCEPDPGFGNGGLGRLAACFLDSAANLHLPVMGYGLRYKEGFFQQKIKENGWQEALPDPWLQSGDGWGVPTESPFKVKFFGAHTIVPPDYYAWDFPIEVSAMAYDYMVPSFDGQTVGTLRLWQATGGPVTQDQHIQALINGINERLYPPDGDDYGKKLRLMQEYFFTSLSLQDCIAKHLQKHPTVENLPETLAVQINDTHPAIAIPELMRLLLDEHKVEWKKAKAIVRQVCHYTNHTLMPEALEKWPVDMFSHVLPRLYGIVEGLQEGLMREVDETMGGASQEEKWAMQDRVSIIHHGRYVRMGHLAAYYSAHVNGVSAMHSELVGKELFPDLQTLRGEKALCNHTNGITPRRWLLEANPALAALITEKTGDTAWVTDLEQVTKIAEQYKDDPVFWERFAEIKAEKKNELVALIDQTGGPRIDPDALFDIQVKRIHEYKRQFMNILHTVALYQDILENPDKPRPNTVKVFAGKAAPSYGRANEFVALIHALADKVNNDERVGDALKVAFIPDYNVSKAKVIIPAADLSEQISTAGTEASGTSNMKFALNGALTMGTRDGANVEIGEKAGEENIFFFGHTKEQLNELACSYHPSAWVNGNQSLRNALVMVCDDPALRPYSAGAYEILSGFDPWRVAADFKMYSDKQDEARELYLTDQDKWQSMSVVNMGAGAAFSSDKTLLGYAKQWRVEPELLRPKAFVKHKRKVNTPAP